MGNVCDVPFSKNALPRSLWPQLESSPWQPSHYAVFEAFNKDIHFSCLWCQKRDSHMYCPVWPKHGQQNEQDLAGFRTAQHPASDCLQGSVHTYQPTLPRSCTLLSLTTGPCSSLRSICVLASWLPSFPPSLCLPITSPAFQTFSSHTVVSAGE